MSIVDWWLAFVLIRPGQLVDQRNIGVKKTASYRRIRLRCGQRYPSCSLYDGKVYTCASAAPFYHVRLDRGFHSSHSQSSLSLHTTPHHLHACMMYFTIYSPCDTIHGRHFNLGAFYFTNMSAWLPLLFALNSTCNPVTLHI